MKKKTKSLKKSNIDVKKKTIPLFLGIVIVILVFIKITIKIPKNRGIVYCYFIIYFNCKL